MLHKFSIPRSTTRHYCGSGQIVENDSLVMTRFAGGFLDGGGNARYYMTDYQGNNIAVIGSDGTVIDRMGYYPYGLPWDIPSSTDYLFADKEYQHMGGLDEYIHGARRSVPYTCAFSTPDALCEKRPWESPYLFCGANPVRYVDPDGNKIEGVTKNDAQKLVEDFRAMFQAKEFDGFRQLIKQSGKKENGRALAQISSEALAQALDGVALSEDQQALVDMTVNAVNSSDSHVVEYYEEGKEISDIGFHVIGDELGSLGISLQNTEQLMLCVDRLYGEGVTGETPNGTYSLLVANQFVYKTNRSATLGHEVIGHGRSLRLGYKSDYDQHVLPIQVENLILRNMGSSIVRDGSDHGKLRTYVSNHSAIPKFR